MVRVRSGDRVFTSAALRFADETTPTKANANSRRYEMLILPRDAKH